MKKFRHYALLLVMVMAVFGCSKDYDDTAIKNDISDLQSRVEKLETWAPPSTLKSALCKYWSPRWKRTTT